MSGMVGRSLQGNATGPQQVFYDPAYGGFVMQNPNYIGRSDDPFSSVFRTMNEVVTGKKEEPYFRINYTDPNQRFQSQSNPYVPSVAEMFPQMNPMQGQVNPMSFGAARFLQGNTSPLVMDYGLPAGAVISNFNIPKYTPGRFDRSMFGGSEPYQGGGWAQMGNKAADDGTMGTG
jgi:hypothetical protein